MNNLIKGLIVFVIFLSNPQMYAQPHSFEKDETIEDALCKTLWDSIQLLNSEGKYFKTFSLLERLEKRAFEVQDQRMMAWSCENQGELYYYKGQFDKARGFHEKAMQVYKDNEKWQALSMIMSRIATMHQHEGDLDLSLKILREAQEYIPLAVTKDPIINISNDLSMVFQVSGQFDSAYHYRKIVLDNIDDKDSTRKSTANFNLASTMMSIYDYEKATEYSDKAISFVRQEKYPLSYAKAIGHKANLEYRKSNLDKAEMLIKECLQILENTKHGELHLPTYYPVYAELLISQGKLKEADEVLDKIEGLLQKKNKEMGSDYYLGKFQLAIKMKDIDQATQSYKKVKEEVEQMRHLGTRAKFYLFESEYFEMINQDDKALISLKKNRMLRDSLNDVLKVKAVQNLEIKYETEKKDSEILLQQDRINIQSKGLGLGALVLGLLSFLLYRNYKNKLKISEQNALISKSLEEKEILLKEIHHRVKNNLQVISSLLSIQSRSIQNVKAKEAIQEGRTRVHSMSLIHQDLYKKDNLTGVRMDRYLLNLTNDLLSTYNVSEGEISLETDIDELKLDVESVVPLGLIVNELMSNSLKYAFPENRNGTIKVSLKEKSDNLILSVSDNGIGLNQEQVKVKTDSFGHSLIRAFKRKLNAKINIESEVGTSITLQIKNYKKVS